ncbi:MAG TPA: DNA replication/repair protein RecF [Stellaceae bacterium]|nr:DNA replication/repair protein RecF [Stellaceae bacterium]
MSPVANGTLRSPSCEAVLPGERASRLAVTRLVLTDFRGYANARLMVDERPVVLTGPNGAGKTNLLEAISFLAPGRGLRRAKLADIDRRATATRPADAPPGAWALAATIATPRGPVQIGTGRDAASESGERRVLRIDGAPAKTQAALAEHVNLVWLTPQMDRLFTEGSSARRRFLDRLVFGFDAEHAARVGAYEQAMRQRARLLRDGPADATWLGALEETMASTGVAVTVARRDVAARLDATASEARHPFPGARLTLAGGLEDWLEAMPALAAEDEFRRRLAAARRSDAESGATAVGPHRGDFVVRHAGTGMTAAECSTGEQKALLLAVLLAQARLQAELRGTVPIMLLDEVTAHLDGTRRAALFAEIDALGAQAWLTGTDAALFEELRGLGQFYGVADAAIAPG